MHSDTSMTTEDLFVALIEHLHEDQRKERDSSLKQLHAKAAQVLSALHGHLTEHGNTIEQDALLKNLGLHIDCFEERKAIYILSEDVALRLQTLGYHVQRFGQSQPRVSLSTNRYDLLREKHHWFKTINPRVEV